MKLFADEHIARSVVVALRADGHEIISVAEHAPGASDTENLALAVRESGGLLTYDSDYGDLVFHGGETPPRTIIYVRMDPRELDAIALRLITVLRLFPTEGRMVVVESDRVRTRAFLQKRTD